MTRAVVKAVVVTVVLAVLAVGGYGVVRARADSGGTTQPAATPSFSPSNTTATSASPAPFPRWQVAKAVKTVTAYRRPSTSAAVRETFATRNANGYPSLFLVRRVRQIGAITWYDVWLPIRPNGSHGWMREGSVAIFTTSARIVIDLSARNLTVYRRGEQLGSFPVAIGTPQLPTPTGHFYVNQKLRPSVSGGPYGVLAIGISAFQMRLPASAWAQGGPVAIHGTNQPELIGQAISHGCVRMTNPAVLKVSAWVPSGSPVDIIP